MRICVFGAGAVGGHIAARLAGVGLDVSVVARGAHLQAIQDNGLRLRSLSDDFTVRVPAVEDTTALGAQDLVIVTLKAHALTSAVDAIKPLLHPGTVVVFATNGIPWWYFYQGEAAAPDTRLSRLDPDGRVWSELGPERVIGCVISSPNEVVAPGVVRSLRDNNTFVLGEPSNRATERLGAIAAALRAGLPGISTTTDIRAAIWNKLMLNVAGSPLSTLTGVPWFDFMGNAEMVALFRRLFGEGERVAAGHGIRLETTDEQLLKLMRQVRHSPSMLQDLLAGRELEVDAILRAVQDLARDANVGTPILDTVTALVAQRSVSARLERGQGGM